MERNFQKAIIDLAALRKVENYKGNGSGNIPYEARRY